jgi:hypothetical protein
MQNPICKSRSIRLWGSKEKLFGNKIWFPRLSTSLQSRSRIIQEIDRTGKKNESIIIDVILL